MRPGAGRSGPAPTPPRTEDFLLLTALVRGDHTTAEQLGASSSFDAERLFRLAVRHRIAGFLYASLERSALRRLLPSEILAKLQAVYLGQWSRNERLARNLVLVGAALEKGGCRWIALKGHHLASRFYGDLARRGLSDLDLLVLRQDLPLAASILEGMGFQRRSRAPLGVRISTRFTHAFEYQLDDLTVDLHWRLLSHPALRLDEEALWASAQPFVLDCARPLGLGDEHILAFLLLEAAKDLGLGTLTLRPFVDLLMILDQVETDLDWPRFFLERRQDGSARCCASLLDLFLDLLGVRGRFERLEAALGQERLSKAPSRLRGPAAWMDPNTRGVQSRLWASGLYEMPRGQAFLWWALALPFQVAAHSPLATMGGRRVIAKVDR